MLKCTVVVLSLMLSAAFVVYLPAQPPPQFGPPAPKAKAKGKEAGKKKGEREPGAELSKAYDLLRRLRADDGAAGRPDERLRDWTDRAAQFYRDGIRARLAGDQLLAREYGAAAHDLARAVDHSRNAVRFDRPDPDLPPPSDNFGVEDARDRAFRDLYRAYDRINWLGTWRVGAGSEYYVRAARDLYSAARRDLEAGRDERAGELARASEAMTHVPEHLYEVGAMQDRDALAPPAGPPAERPVPKGQPVTSPPPRGLALPPVLPQG